MQWCIIFIHSNTDWDAMNEAVIWYDMSHIDEDAWGLTKEQHSCHGTNYAIVYIIQYTVYKFLMVARCASWLLMAMATHHIYCEMHTVPERKYTCHIIWHRYHSCRLDALVQQQRQRMQCRRAHDLCTIDSTSTVLASLSTCSSQVFASAEVLHQPGRRHWHRRRCRRAP